MSYKAPFNYIGNKYRIINQLFDYFPTQPNRYMDLFCGGGDILINIEAKEKYANDINFFVIGIYTWLQNHSTEECLQYIDAKISEYNLSKTNREGFLKFRSDYNALDFRQRNPLDLYVLICFSFNYQIRFNEALEFNNPFGTNRSCFTSSMRNNFEHFCDRIKNVSFSSKDFREIDFSIFEENDFLYADPPYTLTCGSYNDGKRGFKGWNKDDDSDLFDILSDLNNRGVMFALSNVIDHKGMHNDHLEDWIIRNNYRLHYIDFNYNNSNYHSNNKLNMTQEVLITNF